MDAIQFGPLLLKKSILVLLFSLLLAYLYMAIIYKKRPETLKIIEQHLISAALWWILLFKFSILLFRPSIIWTNPFGIIFFTGGTKGIYLASIVALFVFYRKAYRTGLHMRQLTATVIVSAAIVLASYFGMMYFI
ncbi:glucan phosphoethanolaminetransferase (alkaline phosphatase superfamily) [Bacillus tianshenii]|uniref:Glucan phosphoethanolaminetransferase (Alkaline phosphatase superfamily) n=1 Tax=Sutcliffiella tianshenii TaxID=1463404 RepID=A0ABS2NXH7_9BACI|nr:hypothetical protein [Bacillus tianshenii]MBM7619123.1 glucan phosphoethanolaminetransferase (alkaline phosphatase superfamily) [Bacillus tianshenii]